MSISKKSQISVLVCIALAALLALLCLFACAAPANAETDFSRKGYSVRTIGGADFLQKELGVSLSQQEASFLARFPDFVRYSDSIPSSRILAEWDEKNNQVAVTPQDYDYTAASGQNVHWTAVLVNGVKLTNGSATVAAGEEDFVTVSYTAQLTVDKDSINTLLNAYYNAAKTQSDREKAYVAALNQRNAYLEELDRYNNVLLPQYNKYLEEYADWKRKDDPYQEYLAEYAQYLEELDAYRNYDPEKAKAQYDAEMQSYQQYLADLERYEQLYKHYTESLNDPKIVKMLQQLATLDYIYAKCQGRTLRNAIMGDTVTQVLAHTDELKIGSGDSYAVELANRSTRNLRNMIAGYEQYTTNEGRYQFYITGWADLKKNFTELLCCLEYFYRVDFIRDQIVKMGKDLPYRILLAQLYEIVNALNDGVVGNYEMQHKYNNPDAAYFDGNFRIAGETPQSILQDCVLADTEDASPLEDGVPQLPQPPEKPQVVSIPKPIQPPTEPIAPQEVASPGPQPQPVEEPQLPQPVPQPAPLEMTQEEQSLKKAFDNGLQPREQLTADCVIQIETQIKKYFRGNHVVTVFFHASENAEPFTAEGERGSFVEYPAELGTPQKTRVGYTCVFVGWTYENGKDVDWNNLPQGDEVHLYPKFEETPVPCDVTWVIEGVEYQQKAPFDSYPQFDGTPEKPDDPDGRKYRFVGWDRAIEKMTEEPARYVAQFEAGLLIEWDVDGTVTTTCVWKDEMPSFPNGTPTKDPTTIFAYLFDSWDRPIVKAESDAHYTAVFSREEILTVGDTRATISAENNCYTASFTASEQEKINIENLLKIAKQKNFGMALSCNNGSSVLTFSAADVFAMSNANVTHYSFSRATTGLNESAYTLQFFSGDQPTDFDGSVRVAVSGNFRPQFSRLYRVEEDKIPTRATFEENRVSFAAVPNSRYVVQTRYNVSLSADSKGVLVPSVQSDLFGGTRVTVSVGELPVGKTLLRIFAVDAEGNTVTVEDNGFVMPQSDVTIYAVLADIYYTVTFTVDGKTVSVQTYRYGETITPPDNPFKAPDGEQSFTFVGWDKTLDPVTQDITYAAVFSASELEDIPTRMTTVLKLAIAAAVVGGVIVIVLAVTIPIVVVRKRRMKRAYARVLARRALEAQQKREDEQNLPDVATDATTDDAATEDTQKPNI